jgi:hypothetical protein
VRARMQLHEFSLALPPRGVRCRQCAVAASCVAPEIGFLANHPLTGNSPKSALLPYWARLNRYTSLTRAAFRHFSLPRNVPDFSHAEQPVPSADRSSTIGPRILAMLFRAP